jgi:hypothetical protein
MAVASESSTWRFVRFGLIVTGRGEEQFLPRLFRSLTETGQCHFEVLRRIGQRSPITSPQRKAKMVGTGQKITNKDEEEFGLPARRFLQVHPDSFVLLIDDLEGNRVSQAAQVFQRYREVLDTMLGPLRHRASVHFLVNMLEAYFFAHAQAVNSILGTDLIDAEGDVEAIPYPKGQLKRLYRGYDEIEHGGQILAHLDVAHVLARTDCCASLRTLFAWCCKALGRSLTDVFPSAEGTYSPLTPFQIDLLGGG